KNGAFPVASGRDILDRLGIIEKTEKKESLVFDSFSPEEQEIIHLLENEALHFDEIARRIRKDSKTLGSLLGLMEIKGVIQVNQEGNYTV
ncbi:MAG TPA: hypothetical protein VFQ63_00320, partial [Patescibacteria group bacterium]|nr:hypothetical protein [Patescibacteria group bacterium]